LVSNEKLDVLTAYILYGFPGTGPVEDGLVQIHADSAKANQTAIKVKNQVIGSAKLFL
jgi:hypothetical protein